MVRRRAVLASDLLLRVVLALTLGALYVVILSRGVIYDRIMPKPLPLFGSTQGVYAVGLGALLAVVPLALPRRAAFVAAAVASAIVVGLGTYGSARVDWWHVVSGGDWSKGGGVPDLLTLALASAPFAVLIAYHAMTRPAHVALDVADRGAPEEDVRLVRRASRAAAVGAFGLALALWAGVAVAAVAVVPAVRGLASGAIGWSPGVGLALAALLLVVAFTPAGLRERMRARRAAAADARVRKETKRSVSDSKRSNASSPKGRSIG